MVRFGPSGNSDSFYQQGFKSSLQMPAWLKNLGLNAYEYQCNKGVKIGREMAEKLGIQAQENGIFLSIHAPYYINMSSQEEEKRDNSRRYILESLQAAKWMGAKRIVVHTGSCSKIDRNWALSSVITELRKAIAEAEEVGLSDVSICPELLGKHNQVGSLEEIVEMCKIDDRLIPTIDFGHVHARSLGGLKTIEDFDRLLEYIGNNLGYDRLKKLHCHFSRVEYTSGGEKKHWTLDDVQYGPEFEPLAELIIRKNLEPVIICESRDYMAEDALKLKKIYEDMLGTM